MRNTKTVNNFLIFAVIFSLMFGSAFTSVFAATQEDIANIENKIVNVQNEIDQLSSTAANKISGIKSEAQRQRDELTMKLNELADDDTTETERNNLKAGIENLEGIINSADTVDYLNQSTYSKFTNEVSELNTITEKNKELAALRQELDAAKDNLETEDETVDETEKETVDETEEETVVETQDETVVETEDETIAETDGETIRETPRETGKETSRETNRETNVETSRETSRETKPSVDTTQETVEDNTNKNPVQDNTGSNNGNSTSNDNSSTHSPIMVGSSIDAKIWHKIISEQKKNNTPETESKIKDSETKLENPIIAAKGKVRNPETSDDFNMPMMLVLLIFGVSGIVYLEKNKNKI